MTPEDAVRTLIEILGRLRIQHMVVGSLSTNYYGIPRATKDADLVLLLQPGQLSTLVAELPGGFEWDPQARFEMITSTTKYTIKIPSVFFEIELFLLSQDEFDQSRFDRRRAAHIHRTPTFVPSQEDVILQKLLWFLRGRRPKDKQDAGDVVFMRSASLDWKYMEAWARRHGTWEMLCELRDEMRPDTGVP